MVSLVRFSRIRELWDAHLALHVAFYSGLVVGGAISLAIFILVFAAFLSGVLQALVAAGTLALAGVTSYITVRDRREALRRELADRVYVPMRKHAKAWQDPEAFVVGSTWKNLEENVPYLTIRVPSDLRKLFVRGDEIERESWIYLTPTTEYIRAQALTPGTNTTIRIKKGEQTLQPEIYLINIWRSGKTFTQYCTDMMSKNYPLIKEWELVLWADMPVPGGGTQQKQVGSGKEVNDYVDKVLRFLESKSEALSYRDEYRERSQIGTRALERIDKELRKRVAPMGSIPSREPGNPFASAV